MKRSTHFLCFLILFCCFSFGVTEKICAQQETELDSLESLLPFANDQQRVDILNGIALNLRGSDSTKSSNYAKQGLALSNKINYCRGRANALIILGILDKNQGDYLQAKEKFLSGLQWGLKCKEPSPVSLAYHSLGNLALIQGDYAKTIRYYIASLRISEQLKDNRRAARTMNNLGALYIDLGNVTKAEEYLNQSLKLHKILHDDLMIAEISLNLANIYQAQGYQLNALNLYLEALQVFHKIGTGRDISTALNNIGTIFIQRHQYKKALPFLLESSTLDNYANDKKSVATTYINLSSCYLKMNKIDSALFYIEKAEKIATENQLLAEKVTVNKTLGEIYTEKGNLVKAQLYIKEAERLSSTMINKEKTTEIANIQIQYETERKSAQLKLLEKDNEIKKLKINEQAHEIDIKNLMLAGSAILLLFLIIITGLTIFSVYLNRQKKVLELSYSAKSSVLNQLNHEIRTPLNSIVGMSQLALESKNFTELKEYLSNVKLSSDELMLVLNNLIAYLQIDRKQAKPLNSPYLFLESLEETFRIFDLQAKSKGLLFTQMVYPGVPVAVNADKQKVNTVLHNLITNAIQHTRKGVVKVEVKMNAEREKDGKRMVNVQFNVTDEGPGLSSKQIKEIFKGESQHRPLAVNGFGIGLKNVKDYTDLLGGHIEVISEIGQGSSFIVEMELEVLDNQSAKALVPALNQQAPSHGQTILVVEDNLLNQRLVAKILEKEGLQYRIASNGREALSLMKQKTFDLVIMDIRMPEMDGIETAYHIRNDEEFELDQHIPIIALTAHDDAEERIKCFEVGMNDYLTKPFNKDVLVQKLTHLMNNSLVAKNLHN